MQSCARTLVIKVRAATVRPTLSPDLATSNSRPSIAIETKLNTPGNSLNQAEFEYD
jgi:hypothetical protein